MVTPEWLFDERKTFSVRFSYSPVNESNTLLYLPGKSKILLMTKEK